MEKDLIMKNAETLEVAARDSLHEANAQGFQFSDLLIKIAFAVGGLAATRIVSDKESGKLLHSKWGLVFLGVSTIFGGVQMMVDKAYFGKMGRLLTKAADAWKWYSVNHQDTASAAEAKRTLDILSNVPEKSFEIASYLQIVFVILGVSFVLIDVFWKIME